MTTLLAKKSAIIPPRVHSHVDGVLVLVNPLQDEDRTHLVILQGTGENRDYPFQREPLTYVFKKTVASALEQTGKNAAIPRHEQYLGFELVELERTHPGHSEFECRVLKLFVHFTMKGTNQVAIMPTGAWMHQSDYERRKASLHRRYNNGPIWHPASSWV